MKIRFPLKKMVHNGLRLLALVIACRLLAAGHVLFPTLFEGIPKCFKRTVEISPNDHQGELFSSSYRGAI